MWSIISLADSNLFQYTMSVKCICRWVISNDGSDTAIIYHICCGDEQQKSSSAVCNERTCYLFVGLIDSLSSAICSGKGKLHTSIGLNDNLHLTPCVKCTIDQNVLFFFARLIVPVKAQHLHSAKRSSANHMIASRGINLFEILGISLWYN